MERSPFSCVFVSLDPAGSCSVWWPGFSLLVLFSLSLSHRHSHLFLTSISSLDVGLFRTSDVPSQIAHPSLLATPHLPLGFTVSHNSEALPRVNEVPACGDTWRQLPVHTQVGCHLFPSQDKSLAATWIRPGWSLGEASHRISPKRPL